jgi:hypothetical protein
MMGSKRLVLTLAMTVGLLALAIGSRGLYARLAAEYWRRQLDAVDDRQVESLLNDVAGLGEPGIPVLVEALGSKRESIARAAKLTLSRCLDDWQTHSNRGNLRRQAILADCLATEARSFSPSAQAEAAELATRMLRWLPDRRLPGRARVVASCEQLFRAVGIQRRDQWEDNSAREALPASMAGAEAPSARRPPPAPASPPPGHSVADLARLPGGALPPDPYPLPESPPKHIEVAQTTEVASPTPPGRFIPPSGSRPVNPLRQPQRMLGGPDPTPRSADPKNRIGGRLRIEPSAVRPLEWDQEEGDRESPEHPSWGWHELETIDLMQSLDAEDQPTRIGARAELVRRGFASEHVEMARRMCDPNPEVRRQLVGQLPGVPGLNATPWLMHLAGDASAEVRLAAISLLATCDDPQLLDRIGAMARQDPDPRIRHVARRLGQRH